MMINAKLLRMAAFLPNCARKAPGFSQEELSIILIF